MAPPVDNVAVLPIQIAVGLAIGFKVGVTFTETCATALAVQPTAFEPVTV